MRHQPALRFCTLAGIAALALPCAAQTTDPILKSPAPIDGRAIGVGRLVPPLTGVDLAGKPWSAADILAAKDAKLLVIAMTSATCPVSTKLAPTLGALESAYADKGVRFVYISSLATDSDEQLAALAKSAAWHASVLPDRDHSIAKALGARSTAEVFILDRHRTLLYRGSVDDQYTVGASKAAPAHIYLRDALDAALKGDVPPISATTAPGCALDTTAPVVTTGSVTYHNRVSRIIVANCLEFHRTGGIAPFSLQTEADVAAHAPMIATMVGAGRMPPWFAAPPHDGSPSPWVNDRTLPPQDKADLFAWLKSGRPSGDPADAPAAPVFAGNWRIGEPDATLQLPKPIAIKATGTMPYQHVKVETDYPEDRWVQAVEIIPTSRQVVHHVLVFVLPKREPGAQGDRLAEAIDETRGFFAAYVPGNGAAIYPDGFAKLLPKGATLLFQIHYTPTGTAAQDQMTMGLKFAATPPAHQIRTIGIANRRISIPPGAPDHAESATLRVPAQAAVLSLVPHMHVRGSGFKYETTSPGGVTATLLDVPRYDFNWQLRYLYRDPVVLDAGTTIKVTARYDNSDNNPANPDPTARVRWGPQTTDEMMLGYIEYYLPGEDAAAVKPADTDRATRLKKPGQSGSP
ncbi:MAG: redoxin family protein [Phycisphaerales bacterium]